MNLIQFYFAWGKKKKLKRIKIKSQVVVSFSNILFENPREYFSSFGQTVRAYLQT